MISASQSRLVRSLHQKKYREKEKLFIAEGPKVVDDLLRSGYKLHSAYALKGAQPLGSLSEPVWVSERELASISALVTPNQVLAVFDIPDYKPDWSELKRELVLAADDIRDPGNMGTMIRIADWFGIRNFICSPSCVDTFNPKTVQASMGSLARVKVYSADLHEVLSKQKPVYAASLEGKNVYREKLSSSGIILIGNESRGIAPDLMKYVTDKLVIPGSSAGADSLNAAMATAIICSEFYRRKEGNNH